MNHATVPELCSDLAAIMAQTVGDGVAENLSARFNAKLERA